MTSARGLAMQAATQPERLNFSPDETAAVLGIGRTVVFDLLRRGELHSVKIGRRRLIPAESVHAFQARLIAEQASA